MIRLLRTIFELVYPASLLAQGLRWVAEDNVFALSKNYDIMAMLLHESGWGYLFILSGIVSGVAIAKYNRRYRRISLYVCGGMWFFVGVSILFSNPQASFAVPLIFLGISSVVRTLEIPRGTA